MAQAESKKKAWQKKRDEMAAQTKDDQSEAITASVLEEFMEDDIAVVQVGQAPRRKFNKDG